MPLFTLHCAHHLTMLRTSTLIGLLLGLAAATALVAWQGLAAVGAALAAVGFGLVLLPFTFLPHLFFAALSWRLLFPPDQAPRFSLAFRAIWIGLSVDLLLPLASIGGEVAKVRLVRQAGIGGRDAVASVVLDKSVQAISLVLWGLIGIAALIAVEADSELVLGALLGAALLTLGIGGFVAVQLAGSFGFLAGLAHRKSPAGRWQGLVEDAQELDSAVRALYGAHGRLVSSILLRLAARLALTLEVWLAAHLMGLPLGFAEALMLKSLTGVLRGAAFIVPGGWGVQEGGFILLGAVLGIEAEAMLALSLATRARELLVSLPGLLAWQQAEGRALWRRLSTGKKV